MSEKGETIRKNITYDTVEDKEIHEWFESLPPRTHSVYIRRVLKEHINSENSPEPNMNEVFKRLDKIEEQLRSGEVTVNKNTDNQTSESENETNDNNYVNADHMIKDLGK